MKTSTQDYEPHIPTREEFHRHYGGEIYPSDFQTDYSSNDLDYPHYANRIIRDIEWEKELIRRKLWHDFYFKNAKNPRDCFIGKCFIY